MMHFGPQQLAISFRSILGFKMSIVEVAESESLEAGEERALQQYSKAKGLALETLTIEDVRTSAEGIVFWANKDLDTTARSPMGQCFNRAVAHLPAMQDIYKDLDEVLRREFLGSLRLSFMSPCKELHERMRLQRSISQLFPPVCFSLLLFPAV